MKLRILSYGVTTQHNAIGPLESFLNPVSVVDYDALVFDPDVFGREVEKHSGAAGPALFRASDRPGHSVREAVVRRRNEVAALLKVKGGVVICILRPNDVTFEAVGQGGWKLDFNKYAFFEGLSSADGRTLPIQQIRPGMGSRIRLLDPQTRPSHKYHRILADKLMFHASFETPVGGLSEHWKAVSLDSVGNPVSMEFQIGAGLLCFIPAAVDVDPARHGAAVVETVRAAYEDDVGIEKPDWLISVKVPRADTHDKELARLSEQREHVSQRIDALEKDKQRLLDYRKLLFGYGKRGFEPIVREAFREIGFTVPEPDSYLGEWDALLEDPSGSTAVCEIEGSEQAIDVEKYRQLLEYVEREAQEGREHKGVLVGNGFRLTVPDAPERQRQFTEHALRGAKRNKFVLVPGTELFKAVCAILDQPSDENLKKRIRDSIFSTIGVWALGG